MTVAAVILAASPASALRDVEGVPNARRLAETAWAGGALPIVVVAPDPDGSVAGALAGTEAVYATPAAEAGGPVGQIARGIDVARDQVDGTEAALVWPARLGWVDAETITSLIEAHGSARDAVLRPAYRGEPGWPVLVPVVHLEALRAVAPDRMPPQVIDDLLATGVAEAVVELGDPGTVHDLDTPRHDLPPFEGPPEPAAGHHHEWGAEAGARPDEAPEPPPVVG
jgi:CTP:molybdopterin cytidylyltransferase MocA